MGSKMHCTIGDHLYGAFWTKSGHFWPSDDVFRGQKVRFVTVWGLKTAWFAPKWPFWSPQGGPKGPKGGQWWLPCKYLKVGPFCGVWNQIWWRTRLLEGQKVSYSRGGTYKTKVNFLIVPRWILLSFQYIRPRKKEFLNLVSVLTPHIWPEFLHFLSKIA